MKRNSILTNFFSGESTSSDNSGRNKAYQKATEFLYDRINYEKLAGGTPHYPFRLQRMRELLDRAGLSNYLYPVDASETSDNLKAEAAVPLVHIAGTKGKGTTATMVAAALTQSGLRTGLYTSPHLHHLEERFRVDGVPCSPGDLVTLVERLRPITEQLEGESIGSSSFFELTTAIGMLHFQTTACEAIVLEVGLGGRLDSTNVCWPSLTAITSIGLDHQHVLGNTLAEIATEKGGIIKPGIPVISGVTKPEARDVIESIAAERSAPLYQLDRDFAFTWQARRSWGSHLEFQGNRVPFTDNLPVDLALDGEHQARNAAIAIAIVQLLRTSASVEIPDQSISTAMGLLQCPGRIEKYNLPAGVLGIVDAAHNEDSIKALCQCLKRRSVGSVAVVFGTSIDKSSDIILTLLADVADDLFLTRYQGNPRSTPTEQLKRELPEKLTNRAEVIEHPIEACQEALRRISPGGTLVVCGSFFLVAETRQWFAEQTKFI